MMETRAALQAAGVAALAGGLLAWYLLAKSRQQESVGQSAGGPLQGTGQPTRLQKRELGVFTREEVAKHNKRGDVWVILQDADTGKHKVYDLTSYVEEHPGGDDPILSNAGRDATEGFRGPQHPANVFVMVEDFLIGTLAE